MRINLKDWRLLSQRNWKAKFKWLFHNQFMLLSPSSIIDREFWSFLYWSFVPFWSLSIKKLNKGFMLNNSDWCYFGLSCHKNLTNFATKLLSHPDLVTKPYLLLCFWNSKCNMPVHCYSSLVAFRCCMYNICKICC